MQERVWTDEEIEQAATVDIVVDGCTFSVIPPTVPVAIDNKVFDVIPANEMK